MKCRKCGGSGKNTAALAVRVKVPNTLPGMDRYKLALPLCEVCGGSGERVEQVIN